MEDLLNYLLKAISNDIQFEVTKEENDGVVTFIIKSPKENMGLLIGKEGKTINAIRTLLKARATLENVRVNIELQEN